MWISKFANIGWTPPNEYRYLPEGAVKDLYIDQVNHAVKVQEFHRQLPFHMSLQQQKPQYILQDQKTPQKNKVKDLRMIHTKYISRENEAKKVQPGKAQHGAKPPPWRSASKTPHDTHRFNYLDNVNYIEKIHKIRIQVQSLANFHESY